MALEGTVKLPGFGPVKKKTAVYGAVGAVILVLGIWWYRQRQAANAAASTAAASTAAAGSGGAVTDPAGNTCSALNPQTGYCPGTAEDQAALADLTGAYDTSGAGEAGLSGYYYGTGASTATTAPGPGNFSDNAEWAQYVEAYITGTLGGDPSATGNAIGKYLTGQPITSDQQNIVNEAIAYGEYPPVAGPNGNPPGFVTSTGTSTGTGSGTVTVPNVTGQRLADATGMLTAAGLRIAGASQVQGVSQTVTGQSPAAGTSVAAGSTVTVTTTRTGAPPTGTGSGTVTVPNVTGQRLADATGMLTAAGLRITGASQVKGTEQVVTGQRPASGTQAPRGSAVTVTTRKS